MHRLSTKEENRLANKYYETRFSSTSNQRMPIQTIMRSINLMIKTISGQIYMTLPLTTSYVQVI